MHFKPAATELLPLAQRELLPYGPGVIIESDTCWVHQGVGSIEYHHIVPQCYGGTNGPQVAVCGNCHTGVHNLSYKRLLFDGTVAKLEPQLKLCQAFVEEWAPLGSMDAGTRELALVRAWGLANVIYTARELVNKSGTLNKKTKVHTEFLGSEMHMLKVLSKTYGVTQDQMLKIAVEELYARRIGNLV